MKLIKTLSILAIVVVVSAFSVNSKASTGYEVGDVATDFKLENIDGKKVSLADYTEAKGFIVIFTCNTCPYAVQYEYRIIALDKKYASKGYPVIANQPNDPNVQNGDRMEYMKSRAASKVFTFTKLMDDYKKI